MQVREVLSTRGLGLGFLASFLGFMNRSEVWPEPTVPMGWGSLFGYCASLGYRNLTLDHQIKGKSHFTSSDGPDSKGKSALFLVGWPWIAKARFP